MPDWVVCTCDVGVREIRKDSQERTNVSAGKWTGAAGRDVVRLELRDVTRRQTFAGEIVSRSNFLPILLVNIIYWASLCRHGSSHTDTLDLI